jgi:hypothetical protein
VYVIVREELLDGQCVLYVGRTEDSLQKRLAQFYRHKYGARSPHKGGQEVIPFADDYTLWVHWAATDDPVLAERLMIERFIELVGQKPYANRIRASRKSVSSKARRKSAPKRR